MENPLWKPSEAYIKSSALYSFQQYVERSNKRSFLDYDALHTWSIQQVESLWKTVLNYFDIAYSGDFNQVLDWDKTAKDFVDAKWFEGIYLSYSEHIFRDKLPEAIALKYTDESGVYQEVSWSDLRAQVSVLQQFLTDQGVEKGDRVVAVLNNTVECIAIFLAVNSLGAIWSCCSPDFGDQSILERFAQIEPKIMFVERSYQYNGKAFSKLETIAHLEANLPSLKTIVDVNTEDWQHIFTAYSARTLRFDRVEFDHPIWILYSSGTTGKPKAITHRTGGNLLEHVKALALHQNVQAGENFLWYSTTGWMMWNYALSSLLCGATLCIYNAAVQYADHQYFWDFVRRAQVHHLGAGAAYFSAIHDLAIADYQPKVIGSTGSPLPIETFHNLQEKFPDAHIISLSGGTDVCSAFLSGCAYKPVYAGTIQCRTLGADIVAVNDKWEAVVDEVGELVIRQPMPSMPLLFWKDIAHKRYRSSYFEAGNGYWNHADWIQVNKDGSVAMFGRSDATLNRGGVRIGTAEIYNVLSTIPAIKDSLVISTEDSKGQSQMILFVQLSESEELAALIPIIKHELRKAYSPRHVPDSIYAVTDIPYTLSGKKLEIPIKHIFSGVAIEKAVSKDIMRNPECLADYLALKNSI